MSPRYFKSAATKQFHVILKKSNVAKLILREKVGFKRDTTRPGYCNLFALAIELASFTTFHCGVPKMTKQLSAVALLLCRVGVSQSLLFHVVSALLFHCNVSF